MKIFHPGSPMCPKNDIFCLRFFRKSIFSYRGSLFSPPPRTNLQPTTQHEVATCNQRHNTKSQHVIYYTTPHKVNHHNQRSDYISTPHDRSLSKSQYRRSHDDNPASVSIVSVRAVGCNRSAAQSFLTTIALILVLGLLYPS